ncbi:hypothetical protein [Actinophytocola sediminis]
MSMTPNQLREYATTVILDHARDVEFLSIVEMAEDQLGHAIEVEDARAVAKLITKATITVSWEDQR